MRSGPRGGVTSRARSRRGPGRAGRHPPLRAPAAVRLPPPRVRGGVWESPEHAKGGHRRPPDSRGPPSVQDLGTRPTRARYWDDCTNTRARTNTQTHKRTRTQLTHPCRKTRWPEARGTLCSRERRSPWNPFCRHQLKGNPGRGRGGMGTQDNFKCSVFHLVWSSPPKGR